MTLTDIEDLLFERGLRLRRAVRDGKRRRFLVDVQDVKTGEYFEASGVDLEQAVENAVAAAAKRPARKGPRRYAS